jgi:hypothetical protein
MRRPALRTRALLTVLAALLGLLSVPAFAPPSGAATGLYRAINLNGPSVNVDGVVFEAEATAGIEAGPNRSDCPVNVPILPPPASPGLQQMLKCFVWGVDDTGGVRVNVPAPNGPYNVTLWTFEDNLQEDVGLLVNGAFFADVNTGLAGTWRQVGPLPVIVTDGSIRVGSRYGSANISGIRIDNAEFPNGYVPLSAPARVLDTRPGFTTLDNNFDGEGIRQAGTVLELEVAGRVGVPNGAASVAINVAVTNSTVPGFLTIYPCGQPRPNASTLNHGANQTVSNMTIARIGTSGRICIFTLATTDIVVDVAGFFATTLGYTPLASPQRVLETRPGEAGTVDGQFYAIGPNQGGTALALNIAGRAGVPVGAASVVLNVTGTNGALPGFLTVYPCDAGLPTAANLNYPAGGTVGNAVVTRLSAAGQVCLFTNSTTDLVVDISGYFPNATVFVPLGAPQRVLETRAGLTTADGQFNGTGALAAGQTFELPITNRVGIANNSPAVTLNIAVTESVTPGFITVFPCGQPQPQAANLNYVAGDTISNSVFAKLGTDGKVCIFTLSATHLVVDVGGTLRP